MSMELTGPDSAISHYRIVSKIGAGGMGEVFLAEDIKLARNVALKILPADLALNQDRMSRFIRESESAATLNHPNIAQIFEIGEDEGTHFIAMEFIDRSDIFSFGCILFEDGCAEVWRRARVNAVLIGPGAYTMTGKAGGVITTMSSRDSGLSRSARS